MTRPTCDCGNLAKKNGTTVGGEQKYYKTCSSCLRKRNKQGVVGNQGGHNRNARVGGRHLYIQYKKEVCETCDFVPKHSCQLDVDHVDGNRYNNDPINLMTLCANCHRLKTFNSKDWMPS